MASYNMRMRAVKIVCFALFSLFFGQERAALSLNVDQAREALSAGDNSSYTVMHAPPNEGSRKLGEEDDDDKGEGSQEVSSSFLDEDADEEDDDSEDEKLSFLEDTDESDLEEEDYDLDAMDDEDAQMVADSMDGEERAAFLQRWEAHKTDRKINGSPDERGAFAEI